MWLYYRRVRSSTSHSIPSLARTAAASRQWLTYREWVTIVTWVPETQKGEEVESSSDTYRFLKSRSPLDQHPHRPQLNISPKVLSPYWSLITKKSFFYANDLNLNIYSKTITDCCTSPVNLIILIDKQSVVVWIFPSSQWGCHVGSFNSHLVSQLWPCRWEW